MSKGGRRGKYHEWLTEEGLTKLGGWARDGLTDEQIAKNIGISRSTLSEWKKKHPDILDTLKKNKEVADIQVENALFKRALGYEYEEVKTLIEEVDGKKKKKIEKTKKHVPADVSAGSFWVRNRKGKTWSNKDDIENRRLEKKKKKKKRKKKKQKNTLLLMYRRGISG